MVDFQNIPFVKLKAVDINEGYEAVHKMLIEGESLFGVFRSIRDMVIFTNKRIISINVQGITGKKKDYTSLPYSKVQAFSIETAGTFDLDCELDLWFSGMGKIRFEFVGQFDICGFNRLISSYIL